MRASAEAWQYAVAATPLVRWLNGPLLVDDGSPEVARLRPAGVSALNGAAEVWVGLTSSPSAGRTLAFEAAAPTELAARVDETVERLGGQPHPNILLVLDDPAVRRAFQPAFLSMTAMAVGMMGFMWWIQMVDLMMEGMPESDDISGGAPRWSPSPWVGSWPCRWTIGWCGAQPRTM